MKKKDIGKLYGEQFQNFESPVSSQEWLAVKAGLGKTKLLALHVTHFKIYYVAAAAVIGTSGVATGVYQYYNTNSDKSKDPIQNEIILQPYVKEEKTDSTIHFNEGVDNLLKAEKNKDGNNKDQNNQSSERIIADTINTNKNIPVKTEESKNTKVDTASIPRPKTVPKRVVYVNKTDTIVVNDTVTEPPKKKRKK